MLCLGVTACGSSDDSPETSPSTGSTDSTETTDSTEPITVKLGVASKLAGHWPMWSGLEQGIFEDAGITVEVLTMQTDTAAVQAMQSGSVDAIIGTVPQIIHANEAGADLVGIAAVQNRPIYRMIAGKDITDVSHLEGKNVGVSEVSLGIDSYLMQAWLDLQGLSEGDYTLVGTGAVSTRVAALSSGGVDVVAIPPPGDTPVIEQGYTDLGFATDTVEHMQWTLLVASRPQLDEKGDDFRRFLAAYVDAAEFVADPANEDAAKTDLSAQTSASPAAADAAYDLMVGDHGISFDGTPDIDGIEAWEPLLDTEGVMDEVYDPSYLPGS